MKFDLGWGNPYFLLEILDNVYYQKILPHDIKNMNYGENNGNHELIEKVKDVVFETTGFLYEYIYITAGATQAINSILRARKKESGVKYVLTEKYGYPFYGDMIKNSGYKRIYNKLDANGEEFIYLMDSPSNPLGEIRSGDIFNFTIWDAVYHNEIYMDGSSKVLKPFHNVMVGSFSKLLGVSGSRVGFVAVKDPFLFESLADVSLKDIATVSIPSQSLVLDILKKIDLTSFMRKGKNYLNLNREDFQKIEYLFDGQKVQEVGMFYCAKADDFAKEILNKAGVKYVELDKDTVRLSMGQTRKVTKGAIKEILKVDGRK